MSDLLLLLTFAVSVAIAISSLDDAFIDLLALGIARFARDGSATSSTPSPTRPSSSQIGAKRTSLEGWSRAI